MVVNINGYYMVNDGLITIWLVVSTYPSEKYESASVGIIIPNIWKNKKCSKPPTSPYKIIESCNKN